MAGVRLGEIAEYLDASLTGSQDFEVEGVSNLQLAEEKDLAYIESAKHASRAQVSKAGALLVAEAITELGKPQVVVSRPSFAFAQVVEKFFTPAYQARGVHELCIQGQAVSIGADPSIGPFVTLGSEVSLGARVTLHPGVTLGEGCVVGDDCTLHPNVTLYPGCQLGNRVIVHAGSVLGADGFGYVQHEGRNYKAPQRGVVVVEDDVEIGANACIDRAAFGETRIGRGAKIDNLVQVAHNVVIGEETVLAGQAGVAGSTKIGSRVIVGGQVGLSDHIEVGEKTMIAARSGVNRSIAAGQIVSGAPAMPHETAVLAQALVPRLPQMRQQIRDLEKRLQALEGNG
jgi:UDP-3-O-[3-hydroxymyristoyl] glucosamine N-acyltransferase